MSEPKVRPFFSVETLQLGCPVGIEISDRVVEGIVRAVSNDNDETFVIVRFWDGGEMTVEPGKLVPVRGTFVTTYFGSERFETYVESVGLGFQHVILMNEEGRSPRVRHTAWTRRSDGRYLPVGERSGRILFGVR